MVKLYVNSYNFMQIHLNVNSYKRNRKDPRFRFFLCSEFKNKQSDVSGTFVSMWFIFKHRFQKLK